ncbi:MAG: B12-binding domain-containing radical SAM protein, partial [Xanthobacteraceae bacterium]
MIYPRFMADSFWNFSEACELVGAQYPAIPLGLITVAALLPKSWNVRLVNRNTEELTEADLAWAEMVMTGGMLFQQSDTLELIDICRARGLPVVVGGPDVSSSAHRYATANFRVVGEAEDIIKEFIAAWDRGDREGLFEAQKFQVDVTKTPIPRFDLLKFEQYLYIGVQFSRGCPFT